jgi:hypothetical protein
LFSLLWREGVRDLSLSRSPYPSGNKSSLDGCLPFLPSRERGKQGLIPLVAKFVAAFEAFHPAGGVNYLLLAGEEWMALAA